MFGLNGFRPNVMDPLKPYRAACIYRRHSYQNVFAINSLNSILKASLKCYFFQAKNMSINMPKSIQFVGVSFYNSLILWVILHWGGGSVFVCMEGVWVKEF